MEYTILLYGVEFRLQGVLHITKSGYYISGVNTVSIHCLSSVVALRSLTTLANHIMSSHIWVSSYKEGFFVQREGITLHLNMHDQGGLIE